MKLIEHSDETRMTQNACDKTNIFPKRRNCAEYVIICLHYLIWSIVPEISNEIGENQTQRNSAQKPITMNRKHGI